MEARLGRPLRSGRGRVVSLSLWFGWLKADGAVGVYVGLLGGAARTHGPQNSVGAEPAAPPHLLPSARSSIRALVSGPCVQRMDFRTTESNRRAGRRLGGTGLSLRRFSESRRPDSNRGPLHYEGSYNRRGSGSA